jgi:hypothetical protein
VSDQSEIIDELLDLLILHDAQLKNIQKNVVGECIQCKSIRAITVCKHISDVTASVSRGASFWEERPMQMRCKGMWGTSGDFFFEENCKPSGICFFDIDEWNKLVQDILIMDGN